MKLARGVLVLLGVLGLMAAPASGQSKAQAGFEMLKTLAGQWEGKSSSGMASKVAYTVVSGGSVVMETLSNQHDGDMVTMYHLDGDRLTMTHYCAAGNQPRMRAVEMSADGKQIAFAFQDATNLPSPDTGHMVRMVLTWKDSTHITPAWTWHEKGKPETTENFEFVRKK